MTRFSPSANRSRARRLPLIASLLLCGGMSGAHAQGAELVFGFCFGYFWLLAEEGEEARKFACAGQALEQNKVRPTKLRHDLVTGQTSRVVLTPPNTDAIGSGTSQDRNRTCVVGFQDAGNGTPYHAFRWTEATGPVDLGTLVPASNSSLSSDASAASDDCGVIVGTSQISGSANHGFRWTSAGGMVGLGAPAGADRNSRAFGVSGAGDVVVGEAEFIDPAAFSGIRTGAFRWTAAGGFQSLGAIEPGFFTSATAVSADGSVIVGNGGVEVRVGNTSTNGSRAFRWTQATGLVPIGPLPGHQFVDAAGVSDNGRIVVGTSSAAPLDRFAAGGLLRGSGTAFRWTEATGPRDLRQLLVDSGVDMTGIALLSVTAMSPDGQWLSGQAATPTTPAGATVGYIVQYCDDAIGAVCAAIGGGTASFALAASAATLNVAAGQSASTTLTITPAGGFNGAVTFACSGLPTGAACSFAPASVTPAGAAATTTLTISTNGGPVALWLREYPAAALAVFMLPLLGWRGRWSGALALAFALTAVLVVGCGGGSDNGAANPPPPAGGTPAGTSTVTVTATSGSGAAAVTSTLALTLSVTR